MTDNQCQGSDMHGFAIAFSSCDSTSASYANNIVSSAVIGFIFNKIKNQDCMKASGIKIFSCKIGQIASPPDTESIRF